MLTRTLVRTKAKSEAEKPFWISYADLMTAMMMLFLATMAAVILTITREAQKEQSAEEIRSLEIEAICADLKQRIEPHTSITVNCEDRRITFGEVGRFAYNDYRLREEAGPVLAHLVSQALTVAEGERGRRWLKQIVVEGYTDTTGSYLYNMHLSLLRSEWVMCLLLDPTKNTSLNLTNQQLSQVRELFLAGGVSFNNAKESAEASRRVEMRLDFYPRNGDTSRPIFEVSGADRCQL